MKTLDSRGENDLSTDPRIVQSTDAQGQQKRHSHLEFINYIAPAVWLPWILLAIE